MSNNDNEVVEAEVVEGVTLPPIAYDEAEQQITVIKSQVIGKIKEHKEIDPKTLSNKELKAKYSEISKDRKAISKIRTLTEKIRKQLKAPALEYGRLVDKKAKDITALFTEEEAELKSIESKFEQEVNKRKAKIEANVIKINRLLDISNLKTSYEVRERLKEIDERDINQDDYGNYVEKILENIANTKKVLNSLYESYKQNEENEKKEKEMMTLNNILGLAIKEYKNTNEIDEDLSYLENISNEDFNFYKDKILNAIKSTKNKLIEAKSKLEEQEKLNSIKAIIDKYLPMVENAKTTKELENINESFKVDTKDYEDYKEHFNDFAGKFLTKYGILKKAESEPKDEDVKVKEPKQEAKREEPKGRGLLNLRKPQENNNDKLSKDEIPEISIDDSEPQTIITNTVEPQVIKSDDFIDVADFIQSLDANTMVKVSVKEYARLVRDSKILEALQNAGVDNWEWYDEAYPMNEDLLNEVEFIVTEKLKEV